MYVYIHTYKIYVMNYKYKFNQFYIWAKDGKLFYRRNTEEQ